MLAKKFATVALPLVIVLAAAQVNAFAPSSTNYKVGVSENTNIENSLINIASQRAARSVSFAENSNVKKIEGLSLVSPKHTSELKQKPVHLASVGKEVKGEIVKFGHDDFTALVKERGQNEQFLEGSKIDSVKAFDKFDDLHSGSKTVYRAQG